MTTTFPEKLRAGDEVRVVAPSRSLAIISPDIRALANQRFADLGLTLSFGKHVEESDAFLSSSVASRVEDIHQAFADKQVKAVISVIGGFNSNQLLRYLDWDLIAKNPKVFCGYSDTTALNNAIFAKTGLVNYSGPSYSTFGQELHFEYTLNSFARCLLSDDPMTLTPSESWSDDEWYKNQHDRHLAPNAGYRVINGGQASGTILGANLCTFNLLQGTDYFPDLTDAILFLEDDEESKPDHFDRDLQSLIQLPTFAGVRGIVIGRFQKASQMTTDILTSILTSKKELRELPIIADVDFGHTSPMITYPIGGQCSINTTSKEIVITKH